MALAAAIASAGTLPLELDGTAIDPELEKKTALETDENKLDKLKDADIDDAEVFVRSVDNIGGIGGGGAGDPSPGEFSSSSESSSCSVGLGEVSILSPLNIFTIYSPGDSIATASLPQVPIVLCLFL